MLYKPLPVENETAFTQILNLTQMIRKYEIPVDKVYFDSRFDATLFIGGIRVLLGDKSDMEDKMAELTGTGALSDGLWWNVQVGGRLQLRPCSYTC